MKILLLLSLLACSKGQNSTLTSGGVTDTTPNANAGATITYQVDQSAVAQHSLIAFSMELDQVKHLSLPNSFPQLDFPHLRLLMGHLKDEKLPELQRLEVTREGPYTKLNYIFLDHTERLLVRPDLSYVAFTSEDQRVVKMTKTQQGSWQIKIDEDELSWDPSRHQLCHTDSCLTTL